MLNKIQTSFNDFKEAENIIDTCSIRSMHPVHQYEIGARISEQFHATEQAHTRRREVVDIFAKVVSSQL